MTAKVERRAALEVRADGRRLVGRAASFDTEAQLPGFREVIRKGAFRDALDAGKDILALADHDRSRVLARTRSGTLRLTEDDQGLNFEIDLPDTTAARDVLALAERGDLGGMSFGFVIPEGGERFNGRLRELTKIDLREISVVSAWPAYEGTAVAARAKLPPRRARLQRFLETL